MIAPAAWEPIGVETLEPAALAAVKALGSTLVVAGPGTGKTELLGQRAAFLLQTGACLHPRRILAISFKRDAATNLRERVERRCGVIAARQLDSMTFDAFAKQILDRFWRALPERWALSGPYRIARAMARKEYGEFQLSAAEHLGNPGHEVGWAIAAAGRRPTADQVNSVNFDMFGKAVQTLQLEPLTLSTVGTFLQLVAMRSALSSTPPALTFPQIACLAAAIIAANPKIRAAFCATYSHVFLDEFQDTTSIQYALARDIFAGSGSILTAVGDDKQRIMSWAGARGDIFAAFEGDFLLASGALGRLSLTRNYRSNERIVAILNVLKQRLAPGEPDFVAARAAPALPDEDIFSLLVASDADAEARAVAKNVAEAIAAGTDHRSVGLLVRQLARDWEDRLAAAFAVEGIAFRNEDRDVGGATIQDLMTEAYSRLVIDIIELLSKRHGGPLWSIAMAHLAAAEGIDIDDDEIAERALALRLDAFHAAHRLDPLTKATAEELRTLLSHVETFFGLDRLRSMVPQYASGDLFANIRAACASFLIECVDATTNWKEAIGRYQGEGQVPLLTITKSKGLEYDLVVLLGLNDKQWWSFQNDVEEGHSIFFVAASRARERLLLTRCRTDRKTQIDEIFGLLRDAGVIERQV